ncbi:MAG: SPOR domain-containing protein [Rhodothermales bacterium]
MKRNRINENVLGVMADDRTVYAILVQQGPHGPEIKRRFSRARANRYTAATPELGFDPAAEQASFGGDDFNIQFGDAGGQANFLKGEFGDLGLKSADPKQTPEATIEPFALELGDILAECEDTGFSKPRIAVCLHDAETAYHELIYTESEAPKKGKKKSSASASIDGRPNTLQLMALMQALHDIKVDETESAFLPMGVTSAGAYQYLGMAPTKTNPAVATLKQMHKQKGKYVPDARLIDAEVPLYVGLARMTFGLNADAAQQKHTLVVRTSADNTLVLFMEGDTLIESESLQSLTSYDAPETICSRVLLQQDELGLTDIDHVLLLNREREDDMAESFSMFFPSARVVLMRQALPLKNAAAADSPGLVQAALAALRLVGGEAVMESFEGHNMLPKSLRKIRIELPFSWHTLVLSVMLFCTVFFFTWRYITMEQEIASKRALITMQDPTTNLDVDEQVLQTRIDSLQSTYVRYVQALNVIDSLLIGSDRWSRTLETITRETAATPGIWIESMAPQGGSVVLIGSARGRDNAVAFAERTTAVIEMLTFEEIRNWPVYNFRMRVPAPVELPEAAIYLREQVAQAEAASNAAPEPVTTDPAAVDPALNAGATP